MGLVGYITIILLNVLRKKGKLVKLILSVIMISFMSFLFIGGFTNADYLNYYTAYQNQYAPTFEIGFRFLMKICFAFGLSYDSFLLFIFIIGISLRILFIKNVANINYVLALFLIYPFIIEIVQVRTFLAMSIVIFSMNYLLFDKRGNVLKYIICISLACTIHSLSVFLFPIIIIKFNRIRSLIKYIPVLTLVIIIFLIYNGFSLSFMSGIFSKIDSERASLYVTGGFSNTYILNFIYIIMNLLLAKWSINIINNSSEFNLKDDFKAELSKKIYYINIILFIYTPFYLLSGLFFRIPRSFYIINYVLFYIASERLTKKTQNYYLYNAIIILYLIIVFILEFYVQRKVEVLYPIIFDNKFF
ncbi:EpsG family protein [Paenibacillus tritici]|uniref:EpsG family protein n=2 Tax=Paenibacillus tritici TaxID=1873425 RepID=A0ABX2DMI5_9BACL|nr:EpsG family protein [Paenibacillus tritici]